jgi:gliding motility-associated-like protein
MKPVFLNRFLSRIKSAVFFFILFCCTANLGAQTFPCDNGARLYFFRNTGGNGSLSYITSYTGTPVITDMFNMPTFSHNALAANPLDNFMYYLEGTNLRKLDASGGSTIVCVMPFSSAYGCIDNLGRFCSINSNSLVIYNFSTCSIVASYSLPALTGFVDLVYNVFDDHFYVGTLKVTTNGVVVQNNIATFVPGGGTYGGVAVGSNGLLYGLNSYAVGQLSAINVVSNTSFSVANVSPGVTSGNSDMASFMCSSGLSATICAGSSATLSGANLFALSNPVYSINPGAIVQSDPVFTVSPATTTEYTLYVTGSTSVNPSVTQSVTASVTVHAQPAVAPTATQSTCSNTLNVANTGLYFVPAAPVPQYSVIWSPVPPSVVSPTQSAATGLPPGITNVTVVTAAGCSVATSFNMDPLPSPAIFTISPPGGTYSLTCTNTVIALSAAPVNYTYSWISLSYTTSGSSVSFTDGQLGTYTVTASNGMVSCNTTQTFVIGQNTVAPSNTVNPASQAVTCNSGAPVTFTGTAISPTVNIQHDWYSPLNPLPWGVPIASSNNSISLLSGQLSPGVYTLVTTNLVNGCTAQKTITITSLSAWPTFEVGSSTNFSIGCVPLHQTTLSIINAMSTQTPPATCSFTFLPPGYSGVVTPSIVLGVNNATTTQVAGTWTIIVQDNSNWCRTSIAVPIMQHTVAPNLSASMLTQTLTCRNPSVIATGLSSTPNTEIVWQVPATPPLLSTATLVIGPENGPNTSSTSLTYANYTVVATNTVNACQSSSVVIIHQNFKPPVSSPTISIGTPTAIYCIVGTQPVVLTTGSSTTTSGGGPLAFVSNPCWSGPSPQAPKCGPSTYSAYVPGVYSLTVEDNYNGCLRTGTINVLDRTQAPVLEKPAATATLDCGDNPSAKLVISLTGTNTGGLRYLLTDYPAGAAFSPTNATVENLNPFLSGTSSTTITVDVTGYYYYVVSNTLTGCQAGGEFVVVPGKLDANFEADNYFGFAPMEVKFTNNTASSSSSSGIASVWSFGNGSSASNTVNAQVTAHYAAPGTYTVKLIAAKGECKDTISKVIKVDMPSKLEVPNIFTPNGDGSNDVFFCKAANINRISCVIMDRWGLKVYETESFTGNIAWDGKNFAGQECAAGVYFYVIKAEGTDGQAYEAKGTVSLLR